MSALQPKIILGVAAHPDDLDFGMAGSVAKWAREGATAYYLILTNGNKGTHDRTLSPEQLRDKRRDEQRTAAELLGVKGVFFCEFNDGELECNQAVRKCIVEIIRKVRPDTVMTFDPSMLYSANHGIINHPDHRAAGQATLDAVYPLARDFLAFPELEQQGLRPHEVATVLLVNFDKSDYYVDITDDMDTKCAALCAHQSQIKPDTVEMVRGWAKEAGQACGCPCAEAFVRIDVR